MKETRALDWRFLLPAPPGGRYERLALIGSDEATIRAAVETDLASVVVDRLDGDRSADAVVCLDGRVSLAAAAASLAPGGVMYAEVGRGRGIRSDADRAVRELGRLGLRPIARYWPLPGFREPQVYLPLDAPDAVRWYFRNAFVITTPVGRLLAPPTRVATRALGHRLARVTPRTCIVLSDAAPDAASRLVSLSGVLPEARTGGAHALVLVGGMWWSRVVVLPFLPGRREPLAALKLRRVPAETGYEQREQENQRAARDLLPPDLRHTVPEPLGLADWAGHVVALERSAEGQWVKARRQQHRRLATHLRELALVSEWLGAFNEHGIVARRPWTAADIDTWVRSPLDEYVSIFGTTEAEQRLADATLARAREVVGVAVPFVWCHNDFAGKNIYCGGDSISVVDWEGLQPGLPATDLLSYLPEWLFRARRMSREQSFDGFRRLFLEPRAEHGAVTAARDVLRCYTARLGLDDRLPALLLVGDSIRRAVRRHRDLVGDPLPADRAREANRFVRYVAILASHTDALFEKPYRWGAP